MDLTKQGRRTILICVLERGHPGYLLAGDRARVHHVRRPGLPHPERHRATGPDLGGSAVGFCEPPRGNDLLASADLAVPHAGLPAFRSRPGWHHLVSALLHTVNVVSAVLLLQKVTSGAWRVTGEEGQAPNKTGAPDFTIHASRITTWGSFFVAAVFAACTRCKWTRSRGRRRAQDTSERILLSAHALCLREICRGATGKGRRTTAASERRTSNIRHPPVLRSSATAESGHPTSNLQEPVSSIQNPGTGTRWYVLSLVLFACGLMSKPTLVPLPFLLLLLDYRPLGGLQSAVHSPRSTLRGPRMPHHASRITHHVSRFTFQA